MEMEMLRMDGNPAFQPNPPLLLTATTFLSPSVTNMSIETFTKFQWCISHRKSVKRFELIEFCLLVLFRSIVFFIKEDETILVIVYPKIMGLLIVFFGIYILNAILALSKTDSRDVTALNVMYTSLNSPSQLTDWKASGGDPCDDSWKGITCSGSSVTEISLSGLGLTGSMGYQLSSLTSVTEFDLSNNNLKGDIPYQLPPNPVNIDLSKNSFTGGVPYSMSQMADLKYLNLGHNQLNGQLSDMFGKLPKLAELDLSYNSLSGNLPQSFTSLSSLNELYLQNNQFTGPINVLANLPLDELNVANNQFTGWIPEELKEIKNLETGGNSWSSGPAPPGQSNKHSDKSGKEGGSSAISGPVIAAIIFGVLLVLALLIGLFSRKSSSHSSYLDEEKLSERRSFTPLASQELSVDLRAEICKDYKGGKSMDSSASIDLEALKRPTSINFEALEKSASRALKNSPSDRITSFKDNELENRLNSRSTSVTCYTLAELQTATGNFTTGRLLAEGSIGRVYKAKCADGKVLAVKKIDSSLFQGGRQESFSDTVSNISKLHHPNISGLLGYCAEQGQNMLVYEYFRNGSLHDFLHLSDDYSKPLTWNTRVRISLGTARAVEYLQEVCSPSSFHKNIKSSNIMLDVELNPRLSECGLATFYQRTSQNLGTGYNAPECTKPSAYTLKSDVYSFGVVMLELLTGRQPFDSTKPRAEQCLVQWATPQLHDIDALEKMVDPALRGLYSLKSVTRFADIIALCVQSEPDFRPPMSEVVQSLVRLMQRSSMNKRIDDDPGASRRTDDSDYY